MGELRETDEYFEILSPLMREDTVFPDDSPSPQETQNILALLLEENARLRALAVTLSNLLGDLPVREWEHAMTAARRPHVKALPSASAAPGT